MASENNKRLSLVYGIALIVLACAIFTYSSWPEKSYSQSLGYFSDDDGKTWYTDSNDLIPPYQHNGHEADGAVIYSYANGSKQFCGFLFRFPEKVKHQIESSATSERGKTASALAYGTEIASSREVKAPGKGSWVPMGSAPAAALTKMTSPDGSELDSVLP